MIQNEHQYQVTKERMGKFKEGLELLSNSLPDKEVPSLLFKSLQAAIRYQIKELRNQLIQYRNQPIK